MEGIVVGYRKNTLAMTTTNGVPKWDLEYLLVLHCLVIQSFQKRTSCKEVHMDGSMVVQVMMIQTGIGVIGAMEIGSMRNWISKALANEFLR